MCMKPVIYLATDHAGFEHKNNVRDWLAGEGYIVEDCGSFEHDALDDFPDFIQKAAHAVATDPINRRGIIFGGSGQGEAMLANRYKGVRATVYYGGSDEIVVLSREHNDANILSIGARFVTIDEAKAAIWKWLHTDALPDEKYKRRNKKITTITQKISDFFATEIK